MGRQYPKFFSVTGEYLLVYSKNKNLAKFQHAHIKEIEDLIKDLKKDKLGKYQLKPFLHDHKKGRRGSKPNNWFPIYIDSVSRKISLIKKPNHKTIMPVSASGKERSWQNNYKNTQRRINDDDLVVKYIDDEPGIFYKNRDRPRIPTIWKSGKYNSNHYGTRHLKQLIGENHFSFPKSIHLMVDILKITTGKNDAVLDFFAGSGTTGEAVLRLNQQDGGNRQFVLIEQLQEHIKICLKRLTKTLQKENLDDDFIYCELAKLNQATIERIQNCVSDEQLEKTLNQLQSDGFLRSEFNFKKLKDQKHDWDNLTISNKKEVLLEALDPNQTYLNLSEIDDIKHNVSPQDKILMRSFYDQKPQSSQKQSN